MLGSQTETIYRGYLHPGPNTQQNFFSVFPLATRFAGGYSKYFSLLAHFNISSQSVEAEQTKDGQTQDMLCMGQEPGTAHLTTVLLLSQMDPFPATNIFLNIGIIRVSASLSCKSFDFGGLECCSQHTSLCLFSVTICQLWSLLSSCQFTCDEQ